MLNPSFLTSTKAHVNHVLQSFRMYVIIDTLFAFIEAHVYAQEKIFYYLGASEVSNPYLEEIVAESRLLTTMAK